MVKKWVNETELRSNGVCIRQLAQYHQWNDLKKRCRIIEGCRLRSASYIDCTLASEWQSYDVYIEWARQQVGFLSKDDKGKLWNLDKDILFKGNKHYSPETCVFVPAALNMFFTNRKAGRGKHPIGVIFREDRDKYIAQISLGSRCTKHLGTFDTPTEAFQAYKLAKESYAKQLAIKYTGLVDPRVIDALNNFTVNIED